MVVVDRQPPRQILTSDGALLTLNSEEKTAQRTIGVLKVYDRLNLVELLQPMELLISSVSSCVGWS